MEVWAFLVFFCVGWWVGFVWFCLAVGFSAFFVCFFFFLEMVQKCVMPVSRSVRI